MLIIPGTDDSWWAHVKVTLLEGSVLISREEARSGSWSSHKASLWNYNLKEKKKTCGKIYGRKVNPFDCRWFVIRRASVSQETSFHYEKWWLEENVLYFHEWSILSLQCNNWRPRRSVIFFLRNQALSSCQVSFVRRLFIYIYVYYILYMYTYSVFVFIHIYMSVLYMCIYSMCIHTCVCVCVLSSIASKLKTFYSLKCN